MKKIKYVIKIIIILILALLLLSLGLIIPIIINLICSNIKIYSMYDKEDLLSFASAFLSFLASVLLGWLALYQNIKANKINDRLLKIEEGKNYPIIDYDYDFDNKKNFIELYGKYEENLTIRVYLKNRSNSVAKKCIVKQVELYSYGNKHVMIPTTKDDYFEHRIILEGDTFHYQFECQKDNSKEDIESMNAFFESQASSSSYEGDKLIKDTKGYFVINLTFLIENINGIETIEKLWCFFREEYKQNDKYFMLSKKITKV